MRPSRALQETSHIVFVTSPRNLSRGRGTIDNVDVSLVCCVMYSTSSTLLQYRFWDSVYFVSFLCLIVKMQHYYLRQSAASLSLFFRHSVFSSLAFSKTFHLWLSIAFLSYSTCSYTCIFLNLPIFHLCTLSCTSFSKKYLILIFTDWGLTVLEKSEIFILLHKIAWNTSQDLDIANDGHDEE